MKTIKKTGSNKQLLTNWLHQLLSNWLYWNWTSLKRVLK